MAQLQTPDQRGKLLPLCDQTLLQVTCTACLQGREPGQPFILVGAGKLGGGRGRRGALVGDEIGDGEVDSYNFV